MEPYVNSTDVKESKRKKLKTVGIIAVAVALFIVVGAFAAKRYNRKDANIPNTKKASQTTTPQLATCMLDGQQYPPDKANRHPLAVIVENHGEARPQSGLSDASIVYESMTEGGITRNLAIFGPKDVKEIGPIRSARLFFMDWLKEYDAFFAHAGGNEDALANIDAYSIKDLNHASAFFYRDNKGRNVASEHTLYSSTEKLYEYALSKKFNIDSSNFETLKFKADGPADPAGKGIEINFSGNSNYNVKWTYDQAANKYLRFLAGKEHKDRNNDAQIAAKNVIVQQVSRTLQPHGSYGSENWVFDTVGEGDATVLRDGKVIEAKWRKSSRDSRTRFYDTGGLEIEFNPGNTWYEISSEGTTKTTVI